MGGSVSKTLANILDADDLRRRVADNLRDALRVHKQETRETQASLAARAFPGESRGAAARRLRYALQGTWPRAETIVGLARALGIDPGELFARRP